MQPLQTALDQTARNAGMPHTRCSAGTTHAPHQRTLHLKRQYAHSSPPHQCAVATRLDRLGVVAAPSQQSRRLRRAGWAALQSWHRQKCRCLCRDARGQIRQCHSHRLSHFLPKPRLCWQALKNVTNQCHVAPPQWYWAQRTRPMAWC